MQPRPTIALIAGVILAVGALVPAAVACSPMGYENSGKPRLLERNIAKVMVERATSIELVVAETQEPIDLERLFAAQLESADARLRGYLLQEFESIRPFAATVTFRVAETLKGPNVGGFRMNAFVGDGSDLESRRRWARSRRDFQHPGDYWGTSTFPFDETFQLGSCWEPPHANIGASYLIFRDESGRILDAALPFAWRHSGVRFTLSGPTFAEVFEPGDAWVRRIRREVMRSQSSD